MSTKKESPKNHFCDTELQNYLIHIHLNTKEIIQDLKIECNIIFILQILLFFILYSEHVILNVLYFFMYL